MPRKYVVLICGILIQICLGGVYAWTVFVPSLRQMYGLSTAQTQAIFGTAIAAWTIAMIPAGRALPRWGPRAIACLAGVFFLGGSTLAALSGGDFWLLWIGAGWLIGAAIGTGYVCALTLIVQWFPGHRGLATGLVVGSFAAGTILEATLAEALLQASWGALTILGSIGVVYSLLIVLGALGLRFPPNATNLAPPQPIPVSELLRDRRFHLAVLGIFCGTFAGLLVIGNLKSMGLFGGLTPTICTIGVTFFAVGNAAGRVAWGWISDRTSSLTIPISLVLLAAAALLILPARASGMLFVLVCVLVGFGYGACFVLYAAHVAREFGSGRVPAVYPAVFLAFGLSGITGPIIGGWLFDVSGSHLTPIIVAAAVTLIGAATTWNMLAAQRRTARNARLQTSNGDACTEPVSPTYSGHAND